MVGDGGDEEEGGECGCEEGEGVEDYPSPREWDVGLWELPPDLFERYGLGLHLYCGLVLLIAVNWT
jgi:hypothetical protein